MRVDCVFEKLILQNYALGSITSSWGYLQSWSKGTTLGLLCHFKFIIGKSNIATILL